MWSAADYLEISIHLHLVYLGDSCHVTTARQQLHPPGRSPDHREQRLVYKGECHQQLKREFCVSGEVGIEVMTSLIQT